MAVHLDDLDRKILSLLQQDAGLSLDEIAKYGREGITEEELEQAKNKLDVGFEYQGEQRVKNIAEPGLVYRVMLESVKTGSSIAITMKPTMEAMTTRSAGSKRAMKTRIARSTWRS